MRKIKFGLLALLIITPLFLIAIDQSYAFLGKWQTKVGNPPPPGEAPPPDPGPGPTPGCSQIVSKLKNDFGLTIRGGGTGWLRPIRSGYGRASAESVGCEIRQEFYKIFDEVFKFNKVKNRFNTSNGWTIECYKFSGTSSSFAGFVYYLLDGYQFANCSNLKTKEYSRYQTTHEFAHLYSSRRSAGFYNTLPWTNLRKDGVSCYYRGFIKSYPDSKNSINSREFESFAEGFALFIYNESKVVFNNFPITNFRKQCVRTGSWFANNIF